MTSEQLASEFHSLGVRQGDALMVHASLRRIGPVEGRAAGVIQALDRAVGPEGTLLMMTSPTNDEPFDYLMTPTDPDNGVLAEIFRTTEGSRSSNHPEGRFSARGHLARRLTADVPWNDYYGPDSPLARLIEAGGKVLRLGADLDTVTLLHYAEYLAEVPNKRRVTRYRRVNTDRGSELRTVSGLDDEHGIVQRNGPDYFGMILLEYLAIGRASQGVVGGATSELLDARELVQFAAHWMTVRFTPGQSSPVVGP